MIRLSTIGVAVVSVVFASLISSAAPAPEPGTNTFNSVTNVPLGHTCDLRDGYTARVTRVAIAKVSDSATGPQASQRYLTVTFEVTRTKGSGESLYTIVRSGGRTFRVGKSLFFGSTIAGYVKTTTAFYLMDLADIEGAQLDLTANSTLFRSSFQWVFSMDLELTAARVAELDAQAEVATRIPPDTTEARR